MSDQLEQPVGSSTGFFPDSEPQEPGTRFACCIEYDGSHYNGWQSQPHEGVRTVQDTLEVALASIAGESIRVHCAGRTDTGVHGTGQIVHFEAAVARSCKAWMFGGNTALPRDVRIHWVVTVPTEFHSRFSAQSRRYRYVIANTLVRPALLRNQVAWHRRPLDAPTMHLAAQQLLGEQDFSAFRAAACQASSPMRNVHCVSVARHSDYVVIDIQANAFLHHMVRNIAGALIAVGEGREHEGWIGELLLGKDRAAAADTASAAGLYLVEIVYPEQFSIPAPPPGPMGFGAFG
ncbi:MAG: tRNA pseudouridine(38-40) synthase TruA [Halioglobus sp.]